MDASTPPQVCPVEFTLDLIDGKWKGIALYHLAGGTRRFNELLRLTRGASQRMLTRQLRELEADGLIVRKVYPEVPPRVEYRLSERGETLRPIIEALKAWGAAEMAAGATAARSGKRSAA